MKEFQLCKIKQQYLYDLANIDKNISIKGNRPYLAVFVKIAEQDYAIPITSKMRRNNGKLRNSETTTNLFGQKGEELGALLFNKMLPVTDDKIIPFDIKKDPDCISLNKKIKAIRKLKKDIKFKANNVYSKRIAKKEPTKSNLFFDNFCCNYKLLEAECERQNQVQTAVQGQTSSAVQSQSAATKENSPRASAKPAPENKNVSHNENTFSTAPTTKRQEQQPQQKQAEQPAPKAAEPKTVHSSFNILNRAKRAAQAMNAQKKAEATQQLGDNKSAPKKDNQSL